MSKSKIKSANKLILKKQDMILLKKSEELKKTEIYGNLYECLKHYTTLSTNDLKKDIVFDSKARLSLLHNCNDMLQQVQSEWYAKTSFEIATQDVFCQLCGRKNRYICYIVNSLNGEELHVGSDCVKHFKTVNGLDVAFKNLHKHIRDTSKEARKNEYDIALGDNINFARNAEEQLSNFPIVLPYTLYTDLKNVIIDCNRIRTAYIQSGGDLIEIIDKFNAKKSEYIILLNKAEKHYEKYKNHPLVCSKTVGDWLNERYPTVLIDVQKSNGLLNETTLQFVFEPHFIQSKLKSFRQCLIEKDVSIISSNENVIRFVLKNDRFKQPLYFTTYNRDFMKKTGRFCLTNSDYKFHINNISPHIESTGKNLDVVINYIIAILQPTGYTLIYETRTSQLYWERRQNLRVSKYSRHDTLELKPIYKTATIEQILQMVSQVLYYDDRSEKEIARIFISKIDISGRWITKEEKDRGIQIASELAGMSKQREFIPY